MKAVSQTKNPIHHFMSSMPPHSTALVWGFWSVDNTQSPKPVFPYLKFYIFV